MPYKAAHLTSSLFFHPSLKHHMNHSLSPIAKESWRQWECWHYVHRHLLIHGINEAVQQIIYYIYYTHYTVCTGSQSEITILNNTILKVTLLCLWLFAAWSCNSLHTVFFFLSFLLPPTQLFLESFFSIFFD